jgi:hypothetical protein
MGKEVILEFKETNWGREQIRNGRCNNNDDNDNNNN